VQTVTRLADSYRAASEDRAVFWETSGGVVLVVADGVGGQPGGQAAAEAAVNGLRDLYTEAPYAEWHTLLATLDSHIADIEGAGYTTLVVAEVTEGRIIGASVGDSEAWFVTAGGHFDLTHAQRRKPYLGSSGAVPIPFALDIPPEGGTLLLATDGLFKYVDTDRIEAAALLSDREEAARTLASLARRGNGTLPDDIAILLLPLEKGNVSKNITQRLRGALSSLLNSRPPFVARTSDRLSSQEDLA
jgi:serine/threonine protein phosphatase PrpC